VEELKQIATLCWGCQRATGGKNGCSWSRGFRPVIGWDAIETKMKMQRTKGGTWEKISIGSYVVLRCPEFVADIPRKRNGY
jgi:hypothetical protein